MGAGARFLLEPFVAFIVGSLNGILVCLSYGIPDQVLRRLKVRDSSGVLMFALSGFHGGWLSAIFRARWFRQGGLQIAGLFVSVGIAITAGLAFGALIGIFSSTADDEDVINSKYVIHYDDENLNFVEGDKLLYHYHQRRAITEDY